MESNSEIKAWFTPTDLEEAKTFVHAPRIKTAAAMAFFMDNLKDVKECETY